MAKYLGGVMGLVWLFWESFFEELQHIAVDAYWQAEYESVCRQLERES